MKNASGKRPPDEAHGPGEETIRPQQCSEAWGSREKKVHKARCSNSASRDCADSKDGSLCTDPNSKFQLKFVKHVRIFEMFFSKCH